MVPLIESKRAEIAEVCRRFGVRKLEVFGSAARGADFDAARSDIDFLVEFESGSKRSLFSGYFALKEALESLLGRSVDLVEPGAVRNPYLRDAIDRSREPVYGA